MHREQTLDKMDRLSPPVAICPSTNLLSNGFLPPSRYDRDSKIRMTSPQRSIDCQYDPSAVTFDQTANRIALTSVTNLLLFNLIVRRPTLGDRVPNYVDQVQNTPL